VVCNPNHPDADLPFPLPSFTSIPESHFSFSDMTDEQIADYRGVLRQAFNEEVDEFDPHVIHVQHAWLMANLALETGVPYVLSVHEANLSAYGNDERFREWTEQALENAGRIVVGSQYLAERVHRGFGIDPDRVTLVRPGLDVARYNTPSPRNEILTRLDLPISGPVVVCAGKLLSCSAVDQLLSAAARYEVRHPDVVTVIAGDGPQETALREQAQRLGLQRTYFLGDRQRFNAAALYQAADLCVIPTRVDPYETVALEAFASGTPVLGTTVGSLPEIIDEDRGGLVPPDRPDLLAEEILRALRERWKSQLGPRARTYAAEHHALETWAQQMTEQYIAAVGERSFW